MIKHPPIYGIGQQVICSMLNDEIVTVKDRDYNGLTWMYAFDGTDLRCGEMYLQPVNQIASTEIQELIKKWEGQLTSSKERKQWGHDAGRPSVVEEEKITISILNGHLSDLKALLKGQNHYILSNNLGNGDNRRNE